MTDLDKRIERVLGEFGHARGMDHHYSNTNIGMLREATNIITELRDENKRLREDAALRSKQVSELVEAARVQVGIVSNFNMNSDPFGAVVPIADLYNALQPFKETV